MPKNGFLASKYIKIETEPKPRFYCGKRTKLEILKSRMDPTLDLSHEKCKFQPVNMQLMTQQPTFD